MPLIYENYVTIRYFLNIIVTLLLLFIEKTKQLSCISFVEGFSSQTQLQSLNYIHMSHSGIGVHRVSTRCGANYFAVLRKIFNFCGKEWWDRCGTLRPGRLSLAFQNELREEKIGAELNCLNSCMMICLDG